MLLTMVFGDTLTVVTPSAEGTKSSWRYISRWTIDRCSVFCKRSHGSSFSLTSASPRKDLLLEWTPCLHLESEPDCKCSFDYLTIAFGLYTFEGSIHTDFVASVAVSNFFVPFSLFKKCS